MSSATAPAPAASASSAHRASSMSTPTLSSTSSNISAHFSQSQLALALSIQKSRPEGSSTIEYCEQLRKCVRASRGIADGEHRYVDSVDFWKDQYSKVYLEKKTLEDKVDQLEEQRLNREGISQGDQDNGNHPVQDLLPQPHDAHDRHNRKRQTADDVQRWLEDQESSDLASSSAGDSLVSLGRYVLRVDRQRVKMENITKDLKDLEHLDEAINLSLQTLQLLETAISNCCLPLRLIRANDIGSRPVSILQQLMHQVTLSFQCCFKALEQICRTIPGRAKKGNLVYQMVIFFKKSLDLLQTIANLQIQDEVEQDRRRLRNKRSKTDAGEYAVNRHLAWALSSITSSLDWKVGNPVHRELLEGILFSILEHTGRLLSEAVFSEHVAKSTRLGNITQGRIPPNPAAAKVESRYMVQILHAAIGNSDRKELVAKVLASDRQDLDPLRHANRLTQTTFRQDLVSKSRFLIQSTLVKSSIGGDIFASLKMPDSPAETSSVSIEAADHVESYGPEWLLEMVWALIGWDLVTGDTGCI